MMSNMTNDELRAEIEARTGLDIDPDNRRDALGLQFEVEALLHERTDKIWCILVGMGYQLKQMPYFGGAPETVCSVDRCTPRKLCELCLMALRGLDDEKPKRDDGDLKIKRCPATTYYVEAPGVDCIDADTISDTVRQAGLNVDDFAHIIIPDVFGNPAVIKWIDEDEADE